MDETTLPQNEKPVGDVTIEKFRGQVPDDMMEVALGVVSSERSLLTKLMDKLGSEVYEDKLKKMQEAGNKLLGDEIRYQLVGPLERKARSDNTDLRLDARSHIEMTQERAKLFAAVTDAAVKALDADSSGAEYTDVRFPSGTVMITGANEKHGSARSARLNEALAMLAQITGGEAEDNGTVSTRFDRYEVKPIVTSGNVGLYEYPLGMGLKVVKRANMTPEFDSPNGKWWWEVGIVSDIPLSDRQETRDRVAKHLQDMNTPPPWGDAMPDNLAPPPQNTEQLPPAA